MYLFYQARSHIHTQATNQIFIVWATIANDFIGCTIYYTGCIVRVTALLRKLIDERPPYNEVFRMNFLFLSIIRAGS